MSDFLFARPSILEGIGRNIDLFGVLQAYNYSDRSEDADMLALKSDYLALCADANTAFQTLKRSYEQIGQK